MLRRGLALLRSRGVFGVARAVARRIRPPRARAVPLVRALVRDQAGLEIGGPSGVFRYSGPVPLYDVVGSLDNCNFAHETLWENALREGKSFRFHPRRRPGWQFIAEARALPMVPDGRYDFVLSSHTLEHLANPLGGLREWVRVIRPGGTLVLVVPHKDGMFDHRRPVTAWAHLLEDDARQTPEDDLTHLPEVLALHDLSRDPGAGTAEAFAERSRRNADTRGMHHHVLNTPLASRIVDSAGLQLRAVEPVQPCHILVVATKPADGEVPDNRAFLGPDAEYRARSPFPSDHA